MQKVVRAIPGLEPMPLWQSVLCFGAPAGVMWASLYLLQPLLNGQGQPNYVTYQVAILLPRLLLLGAALAAFRLEGSPWDWRAMRMRFRLRKMDRKGWLWAGAVAALAVAGYWLLMPVVLLLIEGGTIPLPTSVPPSLDPRVGQSSWAGPASEGAINRWWLALVAVVLFLSLLGEELWWRGYVFPRQEARHGRHTWLLHGFLWMLSHAFKYWEYLALLPLCLGLSWLVQRRRNTWPGVLVRVAFSGVGQLVLLALALRLGDAVPA